MTANIHSVHWWLILSICVANKRSLHFTPVMAGNLICAPISSTTLSLPFAFVEVSCEASRLSALATHRASVVNNIKLSVGRKTCFASLDLCRRFDEWILHKD